MKTEELRIIGTGFRPKGNINLQSHLCYKLLKVSFPSIPLLTNNLKNCLTHSKSHGKSSRILLYYQTQCFKCYSPENFLQTPLRFPRLIMMMVTSPVAIKSCPTIPLWHWILKHLSPFLVLSKALKLLEFLELRSSTAEKSTVSSAA